MDSLECYKKSIEFAVQYNIFHHFPAMDGCSLASENAHHRHTFGCSYCWRSNGSSRHQLLPERSDVGTRIRHADTSHAVNRSDYMVSHQPTAYAAFDSLQCRYHTKDSYNVAERVCHASYECCIFVETDASAFILPCTGKLLIRYRIIDGIARFLRIFRRLNVLRHANSADNLCPACSAYKIRDYSLRTITNIRPRTLKALLSTLL